MLAMILFPPINLTVSRHEFIIYITIICYGSLFTGSTTLYDQDTFDYKMLDRCNNV